MVVKLTKNETQLALKLADAGPTDEEAMAWVTDIIDRRMKRKVEVIHIADQDAPEAWCGYKIKVYDPTSPEFNKRPACRKCHNIMMARASAMSRSLEVLGTIFRDNVDFNNEVFDNLERQWKAAAE